jgi:hypothetical protein
MEIPATRDESVATQGRSFGFGFFGLSAKEAFGSSDFEHLLLCACGVAAGVRTLTVFEWLFCGLR